MSKEVLQESIEKEKAARKKAERLLKNKADELSAFNKKLKKKNKSLRFKNKALGLLMSIINLAHTEDADVNQTLQRYLKEVCKFCNWPLGHIYFLKKDPINRTKLIPSTIWYGKREEKFKTFIAKTMQTEFFSGEGIPGSVMKEQQPMWIEHLFKDDLYERQSEGRTLSMIGAYVVPLFAFGEIYAIAEFFIDDSSKKKKYYLEFAGSAGIQVSIIIERRLSTDNERIKNQELEAALKELKQIQLQLIQTSKMASLGQLAAGIAHEINNPISYLENNLRVLRKYVDYFINIRDKRHAFVNKLTEAITFLQDISADKASYDNDSKKINYLLADIEDLLSESLEGAHRVTEIVQELKSFARLDEAENKITNINECIESTLKVINNELKYKCELEKSLSQDIPSIMCNPGQINQVIMNIVVNASQAIEGKGLITIKTYQINNEICISISDTGSGIPPENINAIFEPFFTTKPVGIGTGLGLSVSYGIIEKHGGRIEVKSELGLGTTFLIFLPIKKESDSQDPWHMQKLVS